MNRTFPDASEASHFLTRHTPLSKEEIAGLMVQAKTAGSGHRRTVLLYYRRGIFSVSLPDGDVKNMNGCIRCSG